MYIGYMAIGGVALTDERFELINTDRAMAYAEGWNSKIKAGLVTIDGQVTGCIDWLENCDSCPGYGDVFAPGLNYFLPETDPAPWYDPAVRDSDRFLGLIGLDVQGADDSTATARVEQALGGGGAIGRRRYGPRTLVVRALAIAVDECGMQVGLNWLRCQKDVELEACVGDTLWFLDCCPDCARVDPGGTSTGPCWAENYAELLGYPPSCPLGTWWPETYDQLLNGPPDTTQWCRWLISYYELQHGLPQFSCKTADCINPYIRQFHTVSITEGPTVLSRRTMHRVGVIAEIEFTIVAADPAEYTPDTPVAALNTAGQTSIPWTDPVVPGSGTDPFAATNPLVRPHRDLGIPELPTDWKRYTSTITIAPNQQLPGNMVPSFRVSGTGTVDEVRVMVLADMDVVAGFVLPKVPDGAAIELNGPDRRVWTEYGGNRQMRNGYARHVDGKPVQWPVVASGEYDLVVDVADGSTGDVIVEVLAAVVSCP